MSPLEEQKLSLIAFQLVCAKNINARRKIITQGISPRQLPRLSGKDLSDLGFDEEEITGIKHDYLRGAQQEYDQACKRDIRLVFQDDEDYPPGLKEIFDPPPYLYALGDTSLLRTPKLAIVGSRRADNYGRFCLQQTIPDLCRGDLTIVSGMAYGIDSMAHDITLREQGKTVGVNAAGLKYLYPPGNRRLIDNIAKYGCIVSEFTLDVMPKPYLFPIRNRIIAGISRAVLVVEAAFKSGSLITARLGLEQNKDIFAFPGRIDSPVSQGTNYLIQQGAKLITCASDILEEFGIEIPEIKRQEKFNISKKEEKVLDLMPGNELKSIDYFVEKSGFSVPEILSLLMGMVLKNVVAEEPGGYRKVI